MALDVSFAEILDNVLRNELAEVHKALPGQVVSYDPTKQTANVQPLVKRVPWLEDGTRGEPESYPVIPNVPVQFPRGGGFVITVPLTAGDFVWLLFSDASTSEVRATGQESEPLDTRRHSMGYPVAIPGGIPDPSPLTDAATADRIVMGKDGSGLQVHVTSSAILLGKLATDFVALSSKVDAALTKLQNGLDHHTHATAGTGTPSGPIPLPPAVTGVPVGSLTSTAATLVKAI